MVKREIQSAVISSNDLPSVLSSEMDQKELLGGFMSFDIAIVAVLH